MKPILIAAAVLVLVGIVVGSLGSRQEPSYAPPSALPSGEVELVQAVPFVLDQPAVHEWRAEKPLYSAGYLLVLKTTRELTLPRQAYEPVLFVGDQTAERCNFPENGTHLVVLVPALLGANGRVALDLAQTPIWFGSLELPERVDAARIARERELARAQGIGPVKRGARSMTRTAREDAIHAPTRTALDLYLADLIELYSPEEVDLVYGLRQ